MAERKPAKKGTQQSAKRPYRKVSKGFTDGESDVLAKIADMPEPDRAMAERLQGIIKASAPALSPKRQGPACS